MNKILIIFITYLEQINYKIVQLNNQLGCFFRRAMLLVSLTLYLFVYNLRKIQLAGLSKTAGI